MKKTTTIIILSILLLGTLTGCGLKPPSTIKSAPAEIEPLHTAPEEPAEEEVPEETSETTAAPAAEETTFEEEQAKAREAAIAFVKTLDGYKNQMGRALEVTSSAKTDCEGCWIVELRFERDMLYYPDKTEHIKVNVHLKDWKMDTYEFG